MDKCIWQFKTSCWEQNDSIEEFNLIEISGKKCDERPIVPLGMLIGAKSHPADMEGYPCAKGVFPPDFEKCPYCGADLLDPDEEDADLWIPPYGMGNGLKLFSSKSACSLNFDGLLNSDIVKKKGAQFYLPSRDGHFAFCSAKLGALRRLLVAIQRDNGKIWIFCPEDTPKWKLLKGDFGGDSLPSWSWSLAVDSSESGLCIPTDQGPVWINIDWISNSINVDRYSDDKNSDSKRVRSVGGIIRVGEYILAPVLCGNNFTIISRKHGDSIWRESKFDYDPSEVLSQLCREEYQEACLGIPVLDESRQIAYWPCRGGYIRATIDNSKDVQWEFRPWETDEYPATALIELGPPYHRTGFQSGFWQLCEDYDRSELDGIVNKIIKIDGDEAADSKKLEYGQFVTTGRANFSWCYDHWNKIDELGLGASEQKELRFPMIQFGDTGLALIAKISWRGKENDVLSFSDIFLKRDIEIKAHVRFVIEGSGEPERALYTDGDMGDQKGTLFPVTLLHVPEISVFIYKKFLYIYFPENNNCYRWSFESMEG